MPSAEGPPGERMSALGSVATSSRRLVYGKREKKRDGGRFGVLRLLAAEEDDLRERGREKRR